MPKIVMNFTENQGIHWMLMNNYIIYETWRRFEEYCEISWDI